MAKLPLFFGNDNKFPFHYVRKVRITFLFAVLATLSSFAQTEKYSITGKVGILSAPAKVYLTYRLGKTTITD